MRSGADAFHGVHHLGHHGAALHGHGAGALRQLIGRAGVVGILVHGGTQLLHGRCRLFQRAGLAFGAGRQIVVALRNLRAGNGHTFGPLMHGTHDLCQAGLHLLQSLHQMRRFVAAPHLDADRQIAPGHSACHVHRLAQRGGDAAHKDEAEREGTGHHQYQDTHHHEHRVAQALHTGFQGVDQALHGDRVEVIQAVNGAGEFVKKGRGRHAQRRCLDHLAVGHHQSGCNLLLERLRAAAELGFQGGITLCGFVEVTQHAVVQLTHPRLHGQQRGAALGWQRALRQSARALRPQHAHLFSQPRRLRERAPDQRTGGQHRILSQFVVV